MNELSFRYHGLYNMCQAGGAHGAREEQKTGCRRNQMNKRRSQCDVAALLERTIMDVTVTTPRRKKNGGTPIG
jgi:hypothetical protein